MIDHTQERPASKLMIPGIAFAVLFIAGIFTMITPNASTEQAINDFYADSGNRTTVLIGVYLIALSGIAFIWFLSALRQTIRRLSPDDGVYGDALLAGGILFLAMMYAGAVAIGTGSAAMLLGGEEQFSHEVLRMLPQLGYGLLLVGGGFGAIAMVFATSLALRRSGQVPGWLSVYGFVTAALLLAAVAYVPMVFFPIWVITISVALQKRSSAAPEATREVAGVATQA
jgi:hypothetical protein